MLNNWLDQWDERRAARGEDLKENADFEIDARLCFPDAHQDGDFQAFRALSEKAATDPAFFDEPTGAKSDFVLDGEWLEYLSEVSTDEDANNTVRSKITDGGRNHALVVLHQWNATKRQSQLAKFFSGRGVTVLEIAMPYHLERSRPGSSHADYMLGPNVGRTLQSVKQAVLDGRKAIRYLKSQGYEKISVVGFSLGSWIAGLIAAHDPAVTKCSLFLSAGSLADMVWTGRATRHIQESIAPNLGLVDLRRAWAPINLENYAERLTRPELSLQLVLAKRDSVVLPSLSKQLVTRLVIAGAKPDVIELNCGHYSISKPPFILMAGWRLHRLLASTESR